MAENGDGDDSADEKEERLTPQSMHPLSPEDALSGFMQVDPEKVKEREECTCEQWPYTGGKPDPQMNNIMRGVELAPDLVNADCPVHGPLLEED